MTIEELIDKSYSLAKSKGFWDKNKNQNEDILLILSNLGEIVKSHKRKLFANWSLYNEHIKKEPSNSNLHNSPEYFKIFIKDTFEDEVANVIIRITDFFGGNNINIFKDHEWLNQVRDCSIKEFLAFSQPSEKYCGNIGEWLEKSIRERCYHSKESDKGLVHILFFLGTIVEEYNIDIERHIEAKLNYNIKRPNLYNRNY